MKFLLLAGIIFGVLSFYPSGYDHNHCVEIINKSEHNITWVAVIHTDTRKAVVNEQDPKLITQTKKSGSKTFNLGKGIWNFIVCVEAEDTSEPFCTILLESDSRDKKDNYFKSITWNGPNSSDWLPATILPSCPKLFPQCNSEVKDE